jgi:hypothetical protein
MSLVTPISISPGALFLPTNCSDRTILIRPLESRGSHTVCNRVCRENGGNSRGGLR